MGREDYGVYVVLLAVLEIVQLGTNFGSFAAVARYVPEFRIRGELRNLSGSVFGLSVVRLITLCTGAAAVALLSSWVSGWLGANGYVREIKLFSLVILFEGFARFVDLIFDSLLRQGYSQLAIVLRNGIRFAALIYLVATGAHISLYEWIVVELAASLCGVVFSASLLTKEMYPPVRGDLVGCVLSQDWRRFSAYGFPFYGGQITAVFQGGDLVRVVVAKLNGLLASAAFGFAAAFAAMLRRYLPVFLFVGILRPLFVVSKEKGDGLDQLAARADMVFRLNLFTVLPFVAVLLASGRDVMIVMTGGKYPDSAPVLLAFVGLVSLQSLRAILEILAASVEGGRVMLIASLSGACAMVAFLATIHYGFPSYATPLVFALATVAAEAVFLLVFVRLLKTKHCLLYAMNVGSLWRLFLLTSGAFIVGVVVAMIPGLRGADSFSVVAVVSAATFLGYLSLGVYIKPFTLAERDLINRVLPKRVFFW